MARANGGSSAPQDPPQDPPNCKAINEPPDLDGLLINGLRINGSAEAAVFERTSPDGADPAYQSASGGEDGADGSMALPTPVTEAEEAAHDSAAEEDADRPSRSLYVGEGILSLREGIAMRAARLNPNPNPWVRVTTGRRDPNPDGPMLPQLAACIPFSIDQPSDPGCEIFRWGSHPSFGRKTRTDVQLAAQGGTAEVHQVS